MTQTATTYTIYALGHPIEKVPHYVGMTNNPAQRLKQHLQGAKHTNHALSQWIAQLASQNLVPAMFCLEDDIPDEQTAREREKHWIHYIEGKEIALTNVVHNECAIRAREEAAALYKRLYDHFSQTVPQEKIELLIRMTIEGHKCVGVCAWEDTYDTALRTISLLEEMPGYGLTLDAIDVAKLTFNMFGYTWIGGES